MGFLKDEHQKLSRRQLMKVLAATGGAVSLSQLPNQWEQPLANFGALPALAQTSPAAYPFENEIEENPTFEGEGAENLQFAIQEGWLVVAEQGASVGQVGVYTPTWILSRPWTRIRIRTTTVAVLPWVATIKVKIKFRFKGKSRFGSSRTPIDDTDLWWYGISGADLAAASYFITKFKIRGKRVELEFDLPAIGSGLYPFYLSAFFPFTIGLVSGATLFPGYFLGPCISGTEIDEDFYDDDDDDDDGADDGSFTPANVVESDSDANEPVEDIQGSDADTDANKPDDGSGPAPALEVPNVN